MFELTLDKVFQPQDLGTAVAHGFEVAVYGYALDEDNRFIALAFGESPTRCKAVWGAFMQGDVIVIHGNDHPVRGYRAPGSALYETIEGDLPGAQGHVTILFHRAALSAYLAEPPDPKAGPFEFFYTFGPPCSPSGRTLSGATRQGRDCAPSGDAPYPIWLAQLRQLLLLPEQPGWANILWPEALAASLAEPVANVAGFAPLWRVKADNDAWRNIYSDLAREGELQVAQASNGAKAPETRVVWTIRSRKRKEKANGDRRNR